MDGDVVSRSAASGGERQGRGGQDAQPTTSSSYSSFIFHARTRKSSGTCEKRRETVRQRCDEVQRDGVSSHLERAEHRVDVGLGVALEGRLPLDHAEYLAENAAGLVRLGEVGRAARERTSASAALGQLHRKRHRGRTSSGRQAPPMNSGRRRAIHRSSCGIVTGMPVF